MEVISFDEDNHYSEICKWWAEHNWPNVNLAILPPAGFVVEDNGKPLAAGWLYFGTDTPVTWFEWIVSNPFADKRKRLKALDLLVKYVNEYADSNHCKLMFHATNVAPWIQRLEGMGFKKAEDVSLLTRVRE